jgi:hypothetical protein
MWAIFAAFLIIRRRPLKCRLPAFHGGNTGSIPVGRASDFNHLAALAKPTFMFDIARQSGAGARPRRLRERSCDSPSTHTL